jgi:hypothetical protein
MLTRRKEKASSRNTSRKFQGPGGSPPGLFYCPHPSGWTGPSWWPIRSGPEIWEPAGGVTAISGKNRQGEGGF